jgi:CheY-like chemotaxis protein
MASNRNELVLAAEDDETEQLLLRRAMSKLAAPMPLQIVSDGKEVLAYLKGEGRFANRDQYPFPSILLLDLKMPRMDGLQVLEWLQQHPELSIIPTLMWTASSMPVDIERAYRLGANGYMVKPGSPREMQEKLELAFGYWRNCEKPVTGVST